MTVVGLAKQEVGETCYHARARFRVRLLSTLLALGAVCCLAVAARQYNTINVNMTNHVKPGYLVELDIFAIILLSFSVIWDAVNFLHDRIAHQPIHPGARVALELLEWLSLVTVATVVVAETVVFYLKPLALATVTPQGWQWSGLVMMFMTCVLIFVLFMYACRETHLRRRSRRQIAAMILQPKTEIELTPITVFSVPAPVIVACSCQDDIYDHLVAGAPSDQPPQYPAVARETHAAEQAKAGTTV